MDYSKITFQRNKHRINRNLMAEILEISGNGLDKKMLNETWTVKDIERFAEYVKVPVTYFFDEQQRFDLAEESGVKYETCKNCIKLAAQNELLERLLEEANEKLENLYRKCGSDDGKQNEKAG